MKRIVTGIAAITLAVTALMAAPLPVQAAERSYTYNYDYWGDVQDSPDFYTVRKVYTGTELGLETNFKNPQGLYTYGNDLYVCDTGNNRIVQLTKGENESLTVTRIITEFSGADNNTFNTPTDIAVDEEGSLYIADKANARILKLDKDLNFVMQFNIPNDSTLDKDTTFQPSKIAIDTAGRVYCTAVGINKGLIKYENDGTFSGFIGATPVTFNWTDYLWKKFASQEQRAQMESFVPTEYENLYMDHEGFVYATITGADEQALDNGEAQAIRKLNLMGSDILVQNGEWYVLGDIYWGGEGQYSGPSRLTDVTVMENDVYVCLDKNRGRLFGYDDQGKMVFACGGNGNMDGYFRQPSAIEHMGHDLFVLDSLDCSITLFITTEFGQAVFDAVELFDQGEYEASGAAWQHVINLNGNYDLAYIGMGRAHLRQKEYKEAMDYFELKYDDENYSKAFKQYRKQWIEKNLVIIVAVILVLFLVPLGIGRVKQIKHEIDIADIFRK